MLSQLKKVAAQLKQENSFLIACHLDPDGDTIGAALGLWFILKKLGKRVVVLSRDPIPDMYRFLPGIHKIQRTISPGSKFDSLICMDAGAPQRIQQLDQLKQHAKTLINIDHHIDNSFYGDLNLVANVSCTAELIFDLARLLKVKIGAAAANCLYVAMMTDTGNFKYENTTAQTFEIAKQLVLSGASPNRTALRVYEERPYTAVAMHAYTALHAKQTCHGKVIWSVIKKSDLKKVKATADDLNGIVDRLRAVKGVEVAILIREHSPTQVKVNFRSKQTVNVQKIAKQLGGGGHVRSAGAIISGKILDAEKLVIKTVKQHVN